MVLSLPLVTYQFGAAPPSARLRGGGGQPMWAKSEVRRSGTCFQAVGSGGERARWKRQAGRKGRRRAVRRGLAVPRSTLAGLGARPPLGKHAAQPGAAVARRGGSRTGPREAQGGGGGRVP